MKIVDFTGGKKLKFFPKYKTAKLFYLTIGLFLRMFPNIEEIAQDFTMSETLYVSKERRKKYLSPVYTYLKLFN